MLVLLAMPNLGGLVEVDEVDEVDGMDGLDELGKTSCSTHSGCCVRAGGAYFKL